MVGSNRWPAARWRSCQCWIASRSAATTRARAPSSRPAVGFVLGLLPFDIAARFAALVAARRAAWVFTSATLSVGDDFSHFATRSASPGADATHPQPVRLRIAGAALPAGGHAGPDPPGIRRRRDRRQPAACSTPQAAAPSCCSSHRALLPARACCERWEWATDLPQCWCGASPARAPAAAVPRARQRRVARHRQLREGVDVRARRCARGRHREAAVRLAGRSAGEGPIEHLRATAAAVPRLPAARGGIGAEAGLRPAGARSEDDRGLIAICDPRLLGKATAACSARSLPEMPATRDLGEATRFLARLAPARRRRARLAHGEGRR